MNKEYMLRILEDIYAKVEEGKMVLYEYSVNNNFNDTEFTLSLSGTRDDVTSVPYINTTLPW